MNELILSVSDFVGLLNQTLEYAYPSVIIVGELANLRVSKGKWVYFDLKDEFSSVKLFGTVYQLPGPLEDGMLLQVRGLPRLHNQFGFSVNVQFMQPVGEGSLKKAADLLQVKLNAEGLFDPSRKRPLPYPPTHIGLITSGESAAYHDFIKIINQRFSGLVIELADVQVQGERAPGQIIAAIEYFNSQAEQADVLVITRGGGSADDLAAFSTEQVTRAVSTSRIPTIVAIGHEVDISLAELAADQRASTPSNAAELLVPDKQHELRRLFDIKQSLFVSAQQILDSETQLVTRAKSILTEYTCNAFTARQNKLQQQELLLEMLSPSAALKRGYAIIRSQGAVISSLNQLSLSQVITIGLKDGHAKASVTALTKINPTQSST